MRHATPAFRPSGALLAAVLLVSAGCNRDSTEEAAMESALAATGADVEISRDGDGRVVTIETGDGTSTVRTGDDLALPAGFPGDLFLPADYRLRNVAEMGAATAVVLATGGSVAQLREEAAAAMAAQGWRPVPAMQIGGMQAYEKENRLALYSFVAREGRVSMRVQVQSAEP